MQTLDLVRHERRSKDYYFKHALVRDALYQSLLAETRTALHLKIAEEIERRSGNRLSEVAEVLALIIAKLIALTKLCLPFHGWQQKPWLAGDDLLACDFLAFDTSFDFFGTSSLYSLRVFAHDFHFVLADLLIISSFMSFTPAFPSRKDIRFSQATFSADLPAISVPWRLKTAFTPFAVAGKRTAPKDTIVEVHETRRNFRNCAASDGQLLAAVVKQQRVCAKNIRVLVNLAWIIPRMDCHFVQAAIP